MINLRYKDIFFFIGGLLIMLLVYNITDYYYDYKDNLELTKRLEKTKSDTDFLKLKKINSEIVGVIKIKNTNINYPIVQSSDNTYYLDHSYTKDKSSAGAIFLDYRNDLENLSKNNIIYGHHRLDNTMFGSLSNLFEEEWLNNKDNSELKHFQKRENIQTIVKWLFFCQFLHFYLAYILRTLYNRDIRVR